MGTSCSRSMKALTVLHLPSPWRQKPRDTHRHEHSYTDEVEWYSTTHLKRLSEIMNTYAYAE